MSTVTPAASVLVSRGPESREVYAILRGKHLKFFGGFWAFPGGKLTKAEAQNNDRLHARRLAACRELFEETGLLIARRADGSFPMITDDLVQLRRRLLADDGTLDQALSAHGLAVRADDFQLIGEITTPAFAAMRFATTFFVAQIPNGQTPTIWPGELERGEWFSPTQLLNRWRDGELVTPPAVMTLTLLGDGPVHDAPSRVASVYERLASGTIHPMFFAPNIQMIPLKTVALPPTAYTNAFLVGSGPRYLIDPGADDPGEHQRLFDVVDEQHAATPLTAIVLTHHHPDHVGAGNMCAARYGVPIWAHSRTAERLKDRVPVHHLLKDGDRLDLGPCPADGRPWHLDVLHTPGHASGHLAFFEPVYRLLFAGDMVSTVTSMVIAPPDGDMAEYLQSLRRLRALPSRLLLASHGNVSADPAGVLDAALEHRAKREQQLLDTLAEGPAAIDDMTARLYRGTPEVLMRFARAQVLAGLLKLQREGRVRPIDSERWQVV